MKKSLIDKKAEAQRMSSEHKDTIYYVLDKPRKTAVCVCSQSAFWKYFNDGYGPVTRFLNGEDIGKEGQRT